jgi:primosomal protein N' (replication factor Y)
MPAFCDVALPVPLEAVFTYRLEGAAPVVGGRVLVPFREKRLTGVVVDLHDRASTVKAKTVYQVLDAEPVLDAELMKLGRWIADYYIAPLGEVLRTMLPLGAEFRRARGYRIAERGIEVLHAAAERGVKMWRGSSATLVETEIAVLNHLLDREVAREETLRSATGATKAALNHLVRRKWIERVDLSAARDAARTVRVAVLVPSLRDSDLPSEGHPGTAVPGHQRTSLRDSASCPPEPEMTSEGSVVPAAETRRDGSVPEARTLVAQHASAGRGASPVSESRRDGARKLNANQQTLLTALREAGGRMRVDALRALAVPRTTLDTLVKRGLVAIEEDPADFRVSRLKGKKLDFLFTAPQKHALDHIRAAVDERKFSVTMLHGVTGSGKTAVYLATMQSVLAQGRGAIMLVPEIGLTPAAAAHLHEVFGGEVAILHSALTDAERAEQWRRIHRGEARMVVGTRSAVFAPVRELALIIVDEEHDNSYKQEETPRYHGRDVAIMRARNAGAAVVLGSATPSLESYHNAQSGKYALVELPDRVEKRPLPQVEIVDMREEFHATGHEQVISRALAGQITQRLERGEQTMLLLNRRGYSAFVLCRACGDTVQCRNCAIAMTHHKRVRRLECHYCGHTQAVPQRCPKCGSEYVQFLGTGSEKLEELLHHMFPQARIARLDRDTVRGRDDFERVLAALNAGAIDILVGTQMIAKGHDFHGVTLVGVVGADAGLAFPDFRAGERTFQLLTQVAGRAGRGEQPGTVIVQTWFPEHYAVQFAAAHDYAGFYEKESRFRSWMKYPPFSAVANFLVRCDCLDDTLRWAGMLGRWLEEQPKEGVRVLGPAPAPLSKLKTEHRYHFVLKSASRARLNALLRRMLAFAAEQKIPRGNLVADVDAVSLL